MTTRSTIPALAAAFALAAFPAAHAQQPDAIEAPITTGFGVYSPYQTPTIRADAGLSEPTPAAGFSNVATPEGGFPWDQFFTDTERSLLQRNGFVARPEAFGSFGELYGKASGSHALGSFVTVDAVLHGLRVSVAEIRQRIERDYVAPELGGLLAQLADRLGTQLNAGREPELAAAALQALAYVETGRALLDPSARINPRVRAAVNAEVSAIEAGRGSGSSTIFPGRRIDYSVFTPPAQYTGALADFHRARTWLGEVGLPMRADDLQGSARAVRMATVLSRTIDLLASESDFGERYAGVYETLAFLDGRSELDITWDMVAGALRGFYGKMLGTSLSPLGGDTSAIRFAAYVEAQVPPPTIERAGVRVLRLLPAAGSSRGIVDRVDPGEGSPGRIVGAAVMADVPGSESHRRVFASRPAEAWIGNLESALLYTVQPIAAAADRTNGQPKFLRSDAWTDLGALRSLGAWADFRHDLTLLPMKTIRVSGGFSNMRGDLGSPGYVEPVPEAWARVAALAGYIRGGFARDHVRGIIGPKLDARLRDIENTAARLMQIATSELANRELTSDQAELIVSMPARIAAYESFTDAKLAGGGAPIVAGASGDGRVPATGHPMTVFAIVPRTDGSGGLMLTRGGVYTYFETENPAAFVRSINSGSGEVAQVLSVSSFVDRQRSFSQNASKFEAIEGAIPAVAAAYVPTREERKRMAPTAELHMESNTVRRSEGELWFTVKAPLLEGSDVIISVMNSGGREVFRMPPVRLEGGERYDLIRAESLQPGLYFVRVTDHSGRTLASGRFAVVQ